MIEGAVREPGQGVVERLEAQLFGPLVDERRGTGPAGAEDVDEGRQHDAQRQAAGEGPERSGIAEQPRPGDRRVDEHGRPVVEVQGHLRGARRRPSRPEDEGRGPRPVTERHRGPRPPLDRGAEDDLGGDAHPHPAEEGRPAPRHRRRYRVPPVEGDGDRQREGLAVRERRGEHLPGAPRGVEGPARGPGAEVEARGEADPQVSREPDRGEAVEGPPARGDDHEGHRPARRPGGLDHRVGGEGGQPGGGDDPGLAEAPDLRKAGQRLVGPGPVAKLRLGGVGTAEDEGLGAGDEVVLVLDVELEVGGDLQRRRGEGLVGLVRGVPGDGERALASEPAPPTSTRRRATTSQRRADPWRLPGPRAVRARSWSGGALKRCATGPTDRHPGRPDQLTRWPHALAPDVSARCMLPGAWARADGAGRSLCPARPAPCGEARRRLHDYATARILMP